MYKLFFILFLCAFSKDAVSKKQSRHGKSNDFKIVGGYESKIEDFPYQAYLLLQKGSDYYQCGGSIITKRHVLTAAHCLEGIEKVYARIGSTDSDSGGTMYSTTLYTRHPLYSSRTFNNDIAVVRMTSDMKLDGVNSKVIPLAQKGSSILSGTMINVTGWGTTSEGGDTSSNLMAVQVPTLSNAECSRKMSGINNGKLCAGTAAGGKDSCQGDSGGPAVLNGKQVGVVSYGYGCARPNYPGVYTNVSYYVDWIKTNTKL